MIATAPRKYQPFAFAITCSVWRMLIFQRMYAVQRPVTTSVARIRVRLFIYASAWASAARKRTHSAARVARSRAWARLSPVASTAPARSDPRRRRGPIRSPARTPPPSRPSASPAPVRKSTQAPPTRRRGRRRRSETGSPSAAASASPFRSTPSAARQSSASWPPPVRAESSQHARPVGTDAQLGDGRAVVDFEGLGGLPRERHRRVRVLALPDVRQRSAVGHGQRVEDTGPGEGADGDDGLLDDLLDEAEPDPGGAQRRLDRGAQLPRGAHERAGPAAVPVGRPHEARHADDLVRRETTCQPVCGTPASAKRSRWRSFEVESTAVSGEIGCGTPSRAAMRAAGPTGQSAPGATTPSIRSASARRSSAGSSSTETIARRSA